MTSVRRLIVTHHGISCDECGQTPITGVRYKCQVCPDFDICETCEQKEEHPKDHILSKIRIPLAPIPDAPMGLPITTKPNIRGGGRGGHQYPPAMR